MAKRVLRKANLQIKRDAKRIPIPKKFSVGKKPAMDYPFNQLEVGESFIITGNRSAEQLEGRITNWYPKFPRKKFTCRRVDKNTVRVWRTK